MNAALPLLDANEVFPGLCRAAQRSPVAERPLARFNEEQTFLPLVEG